jgi:hypothetical protein
MFDQHIPTSTTKPVSDKPIPERKPWSPINLVFLLPIGGAILGGLFGFFGFRTANGAPQQGASAAMACMLAVVPYVFARSVAGLRG